MARLFRPARIEYDILTARPDSAEAAEAADAAQCWTTAAVDAVTPHPLSGLDLLREYALGVVPRLQDFAVHIWPVGQGQSPALHQSPALLYDAYLRVRSMIRDKDGNALAKVHATGWVLLPGEFEPEINRGIIGLVNFGLPMILRSVDRGEYETALASLMKARSTVNAALQAVLNIAVSAPEPPSRDKLAAALHVAPADLDNWYNGFHS
ncbi:hypothetical protein ABH926_004258 [Catenulispora sp. GP43]|uniref:hypothetical protein n=1 Tax=Catenulispora sp. GP43 TaxID=3156263 RepID=UPI00351160C2